MFAEICECLGVFVGSLGVIGLIAYGIRDLFGSDLRPELEHYTSEEGKAEIKQDKAIHCPGAIFAVDTRMRRHSFTGRSFRMGIARLKTVQYEPIPEAGWQKFERTHPLGLFSTYKRRFGHHFVRFRQLRLADCMLSEPDGIRTYLFTCASDVAIYAVFFVPLIGGV